MASSKKSLELDARVQVLVDEEFSDFEKYLPTLQDKNLYKRKRKEYWGKISARLKEESLDGRTDDSGSN